MFEHTTDDVPITNERYTTPNALLAALALMALALLLVVWRSQAPAPQAIDAPADQFSAARAFAVLEELLAEGVPHPTDTEANERVMARIVAHLEELGYEAEIQDTLACNQFDFLPGATYCARVRNVMTQLPGEVDGPAVMLVAHYDSVPAGPGAADDASGVAIILEAARILQREGPHRNPIIFLFTDGEEVALSGAQAFADEHPWAQNVGVVLNLEARGTSGRSLMFETSDNNAWLVDAYVRSVSNLSTSSLLYEIYRILPNETDLTVFLAAGMVGMNFAFVEELSHYHTPLDSLEYLDPASVQHQGDQVLALARTLAAQDLASPGQGNAAYMDVLGLWVIQWPEAWTLPLAVLALLVLAAVTGVLMRRNRLTVGALLWGVLATLLTVVVSILLGLALIFLIMRGELQPWLAYPLPVRIALWAGALLSGSLLALAFARRAGVWGLGLSMWFIWALAALLLAIVLTGAAIIFLVPTFAATLLMAVIVLSGQHDVPATRAAAFATAAFVAGLVVLPLALLMEAAVGLMLNPAITFWLALVVSTLMPLLALRPQARRAGRWLLGATAGVTLVATVIALMAPAYSEQRPQHLNLLYVADGDSGAAYWIPETFGFGDIPEPLRQAANFDQEVLAHPLSPQPQIAAVAPAIDAPPPTWQIMADERRDGQRLLTVRLHSPRGGDRLELLAPAGNLRALTIGERTFATDLAESRNNYHRLWCVGRSCDGLEVTLAYGNEEVGEFLLSDETYGLPPEGERLIQARPATAVPAHDGDLTRITRRLNP